MKARIKEIIDNRWLIFALRVVLGGIFIAASVTKLQHQTEFVNIVIGYGVLPESLARFYALVVPWAELVIGCSLVLGIFPRLASALSIPLIVSFIVASAYSLFQPVGDPCGCFGPSIPISHSASLAIDVVMLLMAVSLLLHKYEAEFLSIGPLLSRVNLGLGRRRLLFEQGSKFAIIALAVLAIGMPLFVVAQGSVDASLNARIDSALKEGKPVLLFFYTEGCPDCEQQKPIIRELEDEYSDRVVFIWIDFYKEEQAVREFDVSTVPTMLLINGKNEEGYDIYRRFVGFTEEGPLRDAIEHVLENGST